MSRFMESIAASLPRNDRDRLLRDAGEQFWAARRLQKTLEIAQAFFIQEADGTCLGKTFLDVDSVGQWARQRYNFWLQHWRAKTSLS